MRHLVKLIFLVSLFIIFFSYKTYSRGYLDGYVVLVTGDTIFGKLKAFDTFQSYKKLRMIDSTGKRVKIKKSDVLYYKRSDQFYRRIGLSYYRLYQDGKVKLWGKLTKQYQTTVYSPTSSITKRVDDSRYYFLEKNGELSSVSKYLFRKQMAQYFADNPKVVELIESKQKGYLNLSELVNIYNKGF